MTKKELIAAVSSLSDTERAKLPHHMQILGIKTRHVRHATAVLADPMAKPCHVWDIRKVAKGFVYYETDRKGHIHCIMREDDMQNLTEKVWTRFLGIIGRMPCEDGWNATRVSPSRAIYETRFAGSYILEVSHDEGGETVIASLKKETADGHIEPLHNIGKSGIGTGQDACRWAVCAFIDCFNTTDSKCRELKAALEEYLGPDAAW